MASNNAKAYDRVFVAGEAAVQRLRGRTAGVRHQPAGARRAAAARPAPAAAAGAEPARTVLYAPTWEGDAEYNDYTSVDTIGADDRPGDPCRARRAPGLQAAPQGHDQPHARRAPSAPRASWDWSPKLRAATRRRPHAGHRRRHPRGDARLRRHDHRRVLGRPRLALPAHREADLHHRPAPRRGAAPQRGAGQPVRRRHRRVDVDGADGAPRRPARPRRAPPGPGGHAAPLLRRPPGRRQHDPLPRRRVRGGRAARPAHRRRRRILSRLGPVV